MGAVGGKFVMLLDTERIVSATDLLATASAIAEVAADDGGAAPEQASP
jgi:hypothetical protein